MTRKVHVVAHTHWDREWYAPWSALRYRLIEVLDGLLDALESDPGLRHFHLDGQVAAVDDYLEARPANEPRLRALAAGGRLAIGPWYTLMDEFLVSGETIVRNLTMGMERAAAFGGASSVGYLPDMFGHVAQMPQILRLAGIDDAVVWRGVPEAVERTGFWWRALDGSTVRAEYLPAGYGNGASLPDDPEALLRRLRAHEAEVARFSADGDPLLLMAGTDHQSPPGWLASVLEEAADAQKDFDIKLTSLAEHLAGASREALPAWQGELRSGARANVLMGVASNRVDVKIAAAVAERALERRAEPLGTLWLDPARWPGSLLEGAWLEMVRNSAHDSICACSADPVALAVLHRYSEATGLAGAVVDDVLRHAAGRFSAPGPVVLNSVAAERSGLVEVTVAGSEAPGGSQVLETWPAGSLEREGLGADLHRLLGELTEAGWLDDGSPTGASVTWSPEGVDLDLVFDPADTADRSLRQSGAAMAEATAQAGANPASRLRVRVERRPAMRAVLHASSVPGFGWSALPVGPGGRAGMPEAVRGGSNWLDNGLVHVAVSPADGTFSLNGFAGLDRLVDSGDAGDTYNFCAPADDEVVSRADEVDVALDEDGPLRGRLRVRRRYTWPAAVSGGRRVGSESVEVFTTIELRAGESMVRVRTGWHNVCRDHRLRAVFPLPHHATHSEAECAFGWVRRGLTAEGGPGEVGTPTFPSRRWVRAGGLTLTHEGLCEYELVDDGWALALTLMRATGVISRPAPASRPNAAGPATAVPGAQMPGPLEVRYALTVEADTDPYAMADTAWVPLEVVHASGGGDLPSRGSHLEVSGAAVSSLRRNGGSAELRIYNPADAPTYVSIPGRRGWLVDLRGQPGEAWEGGFALRGWGIATARLDPSGAGGA